MTTNPLLEIEVIKITKPLDIGDYAEEYRGKLLHVWVNLTKRKIFEYEKNQADLAKLVGELSRATGNKLVDRVLFNRARVKKLNNSIENATLDTYEWFAEIWSQSSDKHTHITGDQVRKFAADWIRDDSALWSWIRDSTIATIKAHQEGLEKN